MSNFGVLHRHANLILQVGVQICTFLVEKGVFVSDEELVGHYVGVDIVDETTGLVRCDAGAELTQELIDALVEAGVSEPHLVNQAMMSELEGLRVAREGDRAEMDAILGELKPLLEEPSNA